MRNFKRATAAILTSALLLFGQAAPLTSSIPIAKAAGVTTYVNGETGVDDMGRGTEALPYKTITFAMNHPLADTDKVQVAAHTYDTDHGEDFPIVLVSGVSLIGAGAGVTIIERNGQAPDTPVISAVDVAAGTVLDGFTISGGGGFTGAGILCGNNGSPTISNNIIRNNQITIIGGRGAGICAEVSGASPLIKDNIIENNTSPWGGGGIYVYGNSPIISGNIIRSNIGGSSGGGILINGGSPSIFDNLISENEAEGGGGIACFGASSANIFNNLIFSNSATDPGGGGLYIHDESPAVFNNTICGNSADGSGGGIYANGVSSSYTIFNCIIWGNGDDLFSCTAAYSDIEDGDAGDGNISKDPLFIGSGSYNLQSLSPCINAGAASFQGVSAPGSDILGTTRAQGTGFDMGAYEFPIPVPTLPYSGR